MNITKDNQPFMSEYMKSEVFKPRREYKYQKSYNEYNFKAPVQARFKLVMKKGEWIPGDPGKSFDQFRSFYSSTRYSYDTDRKTFAIDEQKGLHTLIKLIKTRINKNEGWNYAKIYMTTSSRKLTKENNYNEVVLNLNSKGQIKYNTSLGFKLYDIPGQDVKSNMISLSKYHFQPLN